ncbi:MAG: DNA gyrase subunit A [Candidatus Marinimicrobia bacterium]|nr:DNA gyrase subunit A [Candidatus Neomarinimicrobiota bacterium]
MSTQEKFNYHDEQIIPVNIEDEMKESYLDYSMSVIVSRALPDVRDGLKPVQRRIMFGMSDLGITYNQSHKKSARIVGEVMGKYHPHGDSAVYDTLVRMAQDFSLRYPLVDGHGNFGSIDGDSAAAMRYTEARMERLSSELMRDINKDTVKFVPNFDETLEEPSVLPSVIPNLLINGASGIAVGMATNIPPHNLTEVVDATIHLINNPDTDVDGIMQYLKGPDFPTSGYIMGQDKIKKAYETGKGKIKLRAKAHTEQIKGNKEKIVITELPYQLNKAKLIKKIARLVKNDVITDISDLRDESGKEGIRVTVEVKRNSNAEVVLNKLYKKTRLQRTFGMNMLALVNGIPRVLAIKEILQNFIDFRIEIVVKRTKYDLAQAKARAHILEGLKKALDNIDEIIKIIRGSDSVKKARKNLIDTFEFSKRQAKAILNMRLQKLTGLEHHKIVDEYQQILKKIEKLTFILDNRSEQLRIIKEELEDIKEKYGDERRTKIIQDHEEFSVEDMIAEEDMIITISDKGFIKRFPVDTYRKQGRGGRGRRGAQTREDDFISNLFIANTHEYLMFFTNKGRCYWLKVHEIPRMGRNARGRAVVNMIKLRSDEEIRAVINVDEFDDERYLVFATKNGKVKKSELSLYGNPRSTGIYAVKIDDDDDLIDVNITDGKMDIVLGTGEGKAIRFNETDVRPMGRNTTGVKGVELPGDENKVVGMVTVKGENATLLVVSENGYGKRTDIKDYTVQNRGGKGNITLKTSQRNGKMIALKKVVDTDDIMIITENGVLIRLPVSDVRTISRNTQGVRLIRLDDDDSISAVTSVVENDEEDEEDNKDKEIKLMDDE